MKGRKANGLTLLTLIFSVLISLSARGAEIAGHIIMAKGSVSATGADGTERQLTRRDPVFVADTIATGEGSRVQIRFIDNGLLALQANSQLAIHTYNQNHQAPENNKVLMELVEGGFRTLTGSIGKGNKEAYRVDTPVASIGIRGTLYSVLMSKGQLFAGVWQGGIRLTNSDGSYDLGMGADYAFAALGRQGFRGLLTPPEELGDAPGAQHGNTDPAAGEQRPGTPAADDGQPYNPVPNPLDQDDDGNTLESLQDQGLINNPDDDDDDDDHDGDDKDDLTDQISPDIRLTDDEFNALLSSTEAGLLLTENGAQAAAVIRDDNDQPVFLTIEGESIDISRFRFADSAADISAPESVEDVEWGIWNGTPATPVDQYLTDNSNDITPLETPVFWVVAEPVQDTVVAAMTGQVSFSGSDALGFDSQGNQITEANGHFDLDFSTGQVLNGSLYVVYGNDTNGSTSNWDVSFDGSIRGGGQTNTAEVSLNLLYGYYTDFVAESQLDVDLSNSKFGGFLTGEAAEAFIGAFHLLATDGTIFRSAGGLVAWPTSYTTGNGSEP